VFALRLSNPTDRSRVQATLPDNLAGVVDTLSVLRTGEAVITGEAARLPIRCRIALPAEEHRPNSEDPSVSENWRQPRITEDYGRVAAAWRSQNPRWATLRPARTALSGRGEKGDKDMERQAVDSTAIASMGYEQDSETLEIEFTSGAVYQYYNVPAACYEALVAAPSKGQFHSMYIRNNYPCSRV